VPTNNDWSDPIALDGFGVIEGSRCGLLQLKTDEYISKFEVKYYEKYGVTEVSVYTSKGYFLTVGKTITRQTPMVKSFEKELKPPNRLIGLHGVKNINKNFNLDRLGIITTDSRCL